jgi:hypothetical protein
MHLRLRIEPVYWCRPDTISDIVNAEMMSCSHLVLVCAGYNSPTGVFSFCIALNVGHSEVSQQALHKLLVVIGEIFEVTTTELAILARNLATIAASKPKLLHTSIIGIQLTYVRSRS